MVVATPDDDAPASVPVAVLAACAGCALGVESWLRDVARYPHGVMMTYAMWLRDASAPDLDNPRITATA